MKRLALLCALALSACARLPTETASRAPLDARADGGMTMGGGQYTPPPCKDANGETVPCP
jgi:hypothetical protein